MLNRGAEPLSAKRDLEGKIVTNPNLLKKLYLETYVNRLRNRKIIPGLKYLKQIHEELFQLRLEKARLNKSPDWSMKDLDKVLSNLKTGKAIDPTGLVNELFRPEFIGKDLKEALLILLNNTKNSGDDPDFRCCDSLQTPTISCSTAYYISTIVMS